MLPEDVNKLSLEDQQQMYMLEQAMMTQEISIPVYFSRYSQEMEKVAQDLYKVRGTGANQNKQQQSSALQDIINTVSANGYQVVISGASHAANKQSKINIIQGELAPSQSRLKTEESSVSAGKLPIIIVTAPLQTLGLINQEVSNDDLSVLLTLVDSFSKLYNSATTAPKYRLMFLVTESNHLLNFQGTKKWLDANFEDNAQNNVEFVVCLDAIGRQQSLDADSLFMHVSKPPKEGTATSAYFKSLKTTAKRYGSVGVDGVHKKINLADVLLAWEHERFSMKRLPAFTLSNLKNHKDPLRSSVFIGASEEREQVLAKNAKIIAESLANYVYKLDGEGEIFTGTMDITKDSLRPWTRMASMATSNDLKNAFEKYLKNVKVTHDKPEAREPEFMLFDGQEAKLNVYNVKPAIFDLFLTIIISAYLTSTYFAILYFPKFYTAVVCKMTGSATSSYVQQRPKVN